MASGYTAYEGYTPPRLKAQRDPSPCCPRNPQASSLERFTYSGVGEDQTLHSEVGMGLRSKIANHRLALGDRDAQRERWRDNLNLELAACGGLAGVRSSSSAIRHLSSRGLDHISRVRIIPQQHHEPGFRPSSTPTYWITYWSLHRRPLHLTRVLQACRRSRLSLAHVLGSESP